ncbi:Prostaglandin D2 receptor 2 [Merluccius polli]|uniref:Prostaglandin D2 receptor 2 n=1 Tax=Merluccius polli TaxID=89951 RepID=A0AA47MEG6_MERPO|nr:Prostaglandin D2 receptor 2 [Merluccius polli]
MSNTNSTREPSGPDSQLFCPILMSMQNHSSNNNTAANRTLVCILGLFSCLGILENSLVLWVVGFRLRRRTVASVWVLNLALSDFLATLSLPLFTYYVHSSHSWDLGGPLCWAKSSIFFLNMFVSAFLLAAISLDRCLLVAKPAWSQNHRSVASAWKVCALGWLWAVVNTFPYFLFRSVIARHNGTRLCYHNFARYISSPSTLDRDCKVRQAATAISKLLLAFLIPLGVIAGSYVFFTVSLRERRMKRKQSVSPLTGGLMVPGAAVKSPHAKANILYTPHASTATVLKPTCLAHSASLNQPKQSLLSQSFTKMVTSVIAAFALCWAPYHVFCLIEMTGHYWPQNRKLGEVGLPIATMFAFLNPLLNPILYAFSCPNFCVAIRQSLGTLFEGLVDEGGSRVFGKGKKMQTRKSSLSRDMSVHATPGSPKPSGKTCMSLDSLPPSTPCSSDSFPHRLKDTNMSTLRQEDEMV